MTAPGQVLILGAGSQIAPFLSRHLAAAGYAGFALSREPLPAGVALDPMFPWRPFDLDGDEIWPEDWAAGAALISSVPLWLLPRHIPMLAERGLTQVVAFSSTSVATKRDSLSGADRRLAERLRHAESDVAQACRERAIPCTVLRPTLVYGSGRDRNVSAIRDFRRRFGFVPVAGVASGLRQPVHADDLAIAAVRCLGNPKACDLTLYVPGGDTFTYRVMVERITQAAGLTPRILSVPVPLILRLAQGAGSEGRLSKLCAVMLRMNQDLAFDAALAHAILGYEPRGFLEDRARMQVPGGQDHP